MTDETPLAAGPVAERPASLRRRLADWLGARLGVDRAAELAAAEARASQAEARLHEAVEAIPEGIVMLDANGRYILWNQTYADIYHRPV